MWQEMLKNGGGKVYSELVDMSVNTSKTVTCGFRPKMIIAYKLTQSNGAWVQGDYSLIYDADMYPAKQFRVYYSNALKGDVLDCPDSSNESRIMAITDTGFTFACSTTSYFLGTYRLIAIG